MASSHFAQTHANPEFDDITLSGLIGESLEIIAGPLAIGAAALTFWLAFDLTLPLPQPALIALSSTPRSEDQSEPHLTADSLPMIGSGLSMPSAHGPAATPTEVSAASPYAVSPNPAASTHSLRTGRRYETAGLTLTSAVVLRP